MPGMLRIGEDLTEVIPWGTTITKPGVYSGNPWTPPISSERTK